jgi:CheY-specific phosphatase CheX
MGVKFFGQFLIENGVITAADLQRAILLQEQRNLKIGELALKLGYVTPADIVRAHNAQLSKDMKLGDILLEMGILEQGQLSELLIRQNNSHLYIGEALVLTEAISSSELQRLLEAFREDQAIYASDRIEFPLPFGNSDIWGMAVDLTYKMITRVLGLRFRTENGRPVAVVPPAFMTAVMDFSGDLKGSYMLSVSAGLQKAIARIMLHEESVENEPVEVLEDTVMEFVNVVCGNVAAKASQDGVILEISPPVTLVPFAGGAPLADGCRAVCFPIHIEDGELMELIIQSPI